MAKERKYEPLPPHKFNNLLKRTKIEVFVDVGCGSSDSISYFWKKSGQRPKATYGFEAEPVNYEGAVKWHKNSPDVKIFSYAVTDETGYTTLHIKPSKSSSNSIKNFKSKHEEIEVKCIRLDDWAKSKKIKKIDFLKTDTQGSDYEVLVGAGNLLDTVQIASIEIWFSEGAYQGTRLFDDVVKLMKLHGLHLYSLDKIRLNKDDSMRWGHAYFYRRKSYPKVEPVISKRVHGWLKNRNVD